MNGEAQQLEEVLKKLRCLKTLGILLMPDIRDNMIGSDEIKCISQSFIAFKDLEALNVSENPLKDGIPALCKALNSLTNLKALSKNGK